MINIIVNKVISGGQTGVDRAALDFAGQVGLGRGGWCPKGRLALDGTISKKYPLKETPSHRYQQRTEWNVRDSDGTLIISRGTLKGGTALTRRYAEGYNRPYLILDIDYVEMRKISAWNMLERWLTTHQIRVLNIAGPREQENLRIYSKTLNILVEFWGNSHIGQRGKLSTSS